MSKALTCAPGRAEVPVTEVGRTGEEMLQRRPEYSSGHVNIEILLDQL